jgi:hypothetical protein
LGCIPQKNIKDKYRDLILNQVPSLINGGRSLYYGYGFGYDFDMFVSLFYETIDMENIYNSSDTELKFKYHYYMLTVKVGWSFKI